MMKRQASLTLRQVRLSYGPRWFLPISLAKARALGDFKCRTDLAIWVAGCIGKSCDNGRGLSTSVKFGRGGRGDSNRLLDLHRESRSAA